MSDWYGACATNAFRVSDERAWGEELATIPNLGITRTEKDGDIWYILYSNYPEDGISYGDWPYDRYDEREDDWVEFDIIDVVYPHLRDGDVAIFFRSGYSKRYWITGEAIAVNNRNERVSVNISEIYGLVERHLGVVTNQITH